MKEIKKYWPLLIAIGLMVVYLIVNAGKVCEPYIWRFLITPTCLVIVAWSCIRHKQAFTGVIICLAFLFSIIGDLCLHNSGSKPMLFIIGVSSFLVAHVLYITFCTRNGKINRLVLGIVTALYLIYFFSILVPKLDGLPLTIACLAYLLTTCISLGAAAGLKTGKVTKWLFLSGIICLALSDTQISIHNFLHAKCLYEVMLPLYYASQILVTAAIIHLNSEKA
jgi:uncharacterized membrane protein YhhN